MTIAGRMDRLKNPKTFVAAGILFFAYGLGALAVDLSRSGWKETEGQVISKTRQYRSGGKRSVVLDYKYQVGGNQYYGEARRFRHTFLRTSLNKPITVYYDPDNPRRSALSAGVTGFPVMLMVIGALVAGVALLLKKTTVAPYPGRAPTRAR